jgi:hypothetical protein
MADTTLAKTILEMMRAELAELEDQQALRVVKPGALQRAGLIRDLLAWFKRFPHALAL